MIRRRSLQLARLLSNGWLAGAPGQLPLLGSIPSVLGPVLSLGSSNSSGTGIGNSSSDGICNSSWLASAGSYRSLLSSSRGFSAAAAAAEPGGPDAASEPLLWQYLRQQCGFSERGISEMRSARNSSQVSGKAVAGTRFSQQKIERDLAPNIAALRAEGLDTPAIEQLFAQRPGLLATTHETFGRSLAALQRLVALLPEEARAVQAPPGATQLGVALWLYPTAAAELLKWGNLASLIDSNLRLRRQLGITNAETARALFKNARLLTSDMEKAVAILAHMQGLQASGRLTAQQVRGLVLRQPALSLDPAEFDRRWREGGVHALKCISFKDAGARQREAAAVLGEVLQAGDGVQGPLQQQYRAQGEALVAQNEALVTVPAKSQRAYRAALRRAGMADSEIAAAVRVKPTVLTYNWEGPSKQRLAAWLQQELGLSLAQFLTQHAGYASYSVGRLALRAAFLQQHRPAVRESTLSRGTGPLLSLLTDNRRFFPKAGCSEAELEAFERAWLQTPAGRRWGAKPSHTQQASGKAGT